MLHRRPGRERRLRGELFDQVRAAQPEQLVIEVEGAGGQSRVGCAHLAAQALGVQVDREQPVRGDVGGGEGVLHGRDRREPLVLGHGAVSGGEPVGEHPGQPVGGGRLRQRSDRVGDQPRARPRCEGRPGQGRHHRRRQPGQYHLDPLHRALPVATPHE
ncbi:hypothetical protein ABZ931_15525 [Streptomyces neyagawaensis]|uniref:Uncharacterized protein n=1 Tax=Streptomyces neyagawaensis TaxID=42238 RepID=A0ABV3AYZ9_9ACTN